MCVTLEYPYADAQRFFCLGFGLILIFLNVISFKWHSDVNGN